jgi:hypothetical protein
MLKMHVNGGCEQFDDLDPVSWTVPVAQSAGLGDFGDAGDTPGFVAVV